MKTCSVNIISPFDNDTCSCIAEKENVQIVTPEMNSSLPSKEKLEKIRAAQDLYTSLLRIPRRSV